MKWFGRSIESPAGKLYIAVNAEGALTTLTFGDTAPRTPSGVTLHPAQSECDGVVSQLVEYFSGRRRSFEVPIAMHGTEFQRRVWNELLTIPYGTTATYAQIARQIGNEKAVRAVGLANGANPISIVVPCHRVIGANGTLTGYGGGLQVKSWLLELERAQGSLFAERR